jgi:L-glutamine-phosphate cytidylyltransferase
MKAILLVAGRGSRLGALTSNNPKPLVELNGQSLLSRAIHSLRSGGITEIGLVTGYHSEMVEPFSDEIFFNTNWATTGIFNSLNCASEWLDKEPCIVSYGDIFYSQEIVNDLIGCRGDISVAYDPDAVSLWSKRFMNPLDDLENFKVKNGVIYEVGGKANSLSSVQGQYMGLFKTTTKGWKSMSAFVKGLPIAERDNIDITSLFSMLINAGQRIHGVPTFDPWGEIDTPSDIKLYQELYPYL